MTGGDGFAAAAVVWSAVAVAVAPAATAVVDEIAVVGIAAVAVDSEIAAAAAAGEIYDPDLMVSMYYCESARLESLPTHLRIDPSSLSLPPLSSKC